MEFNELVCETTISDHSFFGGMIGFSIFVILFSADIFFIYASHYICPSSVLILSYYHGYTIDIIMLHFKNLIAQIFRNRHKKDKLNSSIQFWLYSANDERVSKQN